MKRLGKFYINMRPSPQIPVPPPNSENGLGSVEFVTIFRFDRLSYNIIFRPVDSVGKSSDYRVGPSRSSDWPLIYQVRAIGQSLWHFQVGPTALTIPL